MNSAAVVKKARGAFLTWIQVSAGADMLTCRPRVT